MADYTPTSADVAAEMPTRTVGPATDSDYDGSESPDFTTETRPRKAQVDSAIGEAVALLAPRLGKVPDDLDAFARRVVTLRTAMLLERRFWPEEVDDERGVYQALKDELAEALAAYDAARSGDEPGNAHRAGSLRVGTLLSKEAPWQTS